MPSRPSGGIRVVIETQLFYRDSVVLSRLSCSIETQLFYRDSVVLSRLSCSIETQLFYRDSVVLSRLSSRLSCLSYSTSGSTEYHKC